MARWSMCDITPTYDNLGRVTALTLPGSNAARSVGTVYDIFGRPTAITSAGRTLSYEYDPGFLWSQLGYPDGLKIRYNSDILGRITSIVEYNSAGVAVQTLATYAYDDLGRRTSVTYGNGVTTAYGFTPLSQLASLTHNLAGTANDVAFSFSYNAAGQMSTQDRNNDVYAWQNHFNVTRPYTANGQNQYTAVGTAQPSYDARGNLKSDGLYQFSFDAAGNFTSATGPQSMSLSYDALGRLAQTATSASITQFMYDGTAMIGEYDGAGTLLRRTVHGPGTDEPIVVYEGGVRKWLVADPRGSIIATTDASGTATATNSYGPWGEEGLAMSGRFGYTGQMRLPELGLMHYKARAYSPRYGRFLQPDPIGTNGGLNVYEYAGSDPVNASDPSGLDCVDLNYQLIICGSRSGGWGDGWPDFNGLLFLDGLSGFGYSNGYSNSGGSGAGGSNNNPKPGDKDCVDDGKGGCLEIAVTATKPKSNIWETDGYRLSALSTDPLGLCFSWGCRAEPGLEVPLFAPDDLITGAIAGKLAGKAAGRLLGPAGPVFGRGYAGIFNRNDMFRIGFAPGKNATAKDFYLQFRIVLGSKRGLSLGGYNAPVHWHIYFPGEF
jgi:RHS repeat-associated protein